MIREEITKPPNDLCHRPELEAPIQTKSGPGAPVQSPPGQTPRHLEQYQDPLGV